MKFSDHVPPEVMTNPKVAKLIKVFDEMLVTSEWKDDFYGKDVEFNEITKAFDPIRIESGVFLRRFFYELGNLEYIYGMPKIIYERMILNAYDIMAYKGSVRGLRLLASSLWLGDVQIDPSLLWAPHFISLGDDHCGFLPDADDLVIQLTDERNFHYLYNGENTYYANSLEIRMISRYFGNEQFRRFVAAVVGRYIASFDPNATNTVYKFYSHGIVGVPYAFYSGDNLAFHDTDPAEWEKEVQKV